MIRNQEMTYIPIRQKIKVVSVMMDELAITLNQLSSTNYYIGDIHYQPSTTGTGISLRTKMIVTIIAYKEMPFFT